MTNAATRSRNFNAKIMAIGLSILLAWTLYENFTMPQLVNRIELNATIVEANEPTANNYSQSLVMIKVKLPNDRYCKILTQPRSTFKPGSTIPIIIEEYDDNSKICIINTQSLNGL